MSDRSDTLQWQRLGALFEQAIDLDAAGRDELLRSIEREDAELGQALASLLDADARHHANTAMHRERVLQGSFDAIHGPDIDTGDRIGPYVLCESLGKGGMGVVFRAERADGQVKQDVALKVIKLGMDTREVIARFEAERQALAMMEHPHIARMLDAGATEGGRPYFVMELVRGEPIWRYCTMNGLAIVQRLRLFEQVCAAVQHAHTKGIIHRDLKPTNVLVSTQDGQPFAKVIDFGIAKATSGRLTEKTLMTEQFGMMGTPMYMSPEQAAGSADIDTRTDIYALGVILYELLTDTTPIDSVSLRKAAHEEVQRIIREVDPPRPSVRLAQSVITTAGTVTPEDAASKGDATKPGADARALAKTVRGELDWIVMKAIEKDRARRYESASAFADDVRRYLAGDAVMAAPPGSMYRLRKLVRRHKVMVAAGSMVAAALLAGILAFAWQARIARQQAQIAQQQARLAQQRAKEVEQVAKFEGDMLNQVDPHKEGKALMEDLQARLAAALAKAGVPQGERAGQVATFAGLLGRVNATDAARDLIDRATMKPAIAAIDRRFKAEPLVAARLRQALAQRYVQMGLYDAAIPLQQSALATRRRVLGDQNRDTLQSLEIMGGLVMLTQGSARAEPYVREALAGRRHVLGDEDPDTVESMSDLGQLLANQNKLAEAEPLFRKALASSLRVNGQEAGRTLDLIGYMGDTLFLEGYPNEAERYDRDAVRRSSHALGRDDPKTLGFISSLGLVLLSEGNLEEAGPLLREALENSRRVLGENHPETVYKLDLMGMFLMADGKPAEAERYFRELLDKSRRLFGGDESVTLEAMTKLATSLEEQGKLDEAGTCLRLALDTSRRALGEKDSTTLGVRVAIGEFLQATGKWDDAETALREALGESRAALGPADRVTLDAAARLGALLVARNRPAEAETLLVPVEAAAHAGRPGGHAVDFGPALMSLGMARAALAEFPAAESDLVEAQPLLVKSAGPRGRLTRQCDQALVDLYAAWEAASPGKGHGAQSAMWKRKFPEPKSPVAAH